MRTSEAKPATPYQSTARPVVYTTRGGAESAQHRAARHESPTQCVTGVEFAPGILRAREGGKGFEVTIADIGGDFEVREVSASEIERRVQSGIRAAITEQYEKAAKEDAAVAAAKTSTFVLMHGKWAREARAKARELELLLTVSGVRRVASEPYFSAERDSRVSR